MIIPMNSSYIQQAVIILLFYDVARWCQFNCSSGLLNSRNIQLIQHVQLAYIYYDIMYKTLIHDDIVYSLKRLVFSIDLKQSIVLAFFI